MTKDMLNHGYLVVLFVALTSGGEEESRMLRSLKSTEDREKNDVEENRRTE